jgi:hypothetical protein
MGSSKRELSSKVRIFYEYGFERERAGSWGPQVSAEDEVYPFAEMKTGVRQLLEPPAGPESADGG